MMQNGVEAPWNGISKKRELILGGMKLGGSSSELNRIFANFPKIALLAPYTT